MESQYTKETSTKQKISITVTYINQKNTIFLINKRSLSYKNGWIAAALLTYH